MHTFLSVFLVRQAVSYDCYDIRAQLEGIGNPNKVRAANEYVIKDRQRRRKQHKIAQQRQIPYAENKRIRRQAHQIKNIVRFAIAKYPKIDDAIARHPCQGKPYRPAYRRGTVVVFIE